MREAIESLPEVLVIAQTSKTQIPIFVPAGQVFDQKLVVFATSSFADMAVLSSSAHHAWSFRYGSTMRVDPVYTPSDVFDNFPRLMPTDRLEQIGHTLDEVRREIMSRRDLGLTKLYNLVNDPDLRGDTDVDRLREIHVELDRAVLEAYGWNDIDPSHGFHTYRHMQRWTVNPTARTEILDRLLEENHRRAQQEKHDKNSPTSAEIPQEDGTLFT